MYSVHNCSVCLTATLLAVLFLCLAVVLVGPVAPPSLQLRHMWLATLEVCSAFLDSPGGIKMSAVNADSLRPSRSASY